MYKVKDKVIIVNSRGMEFKAEIVNVNEYREPSMKYGVIVEDFDDYVFIGENQIVRRQE